jgi:hypothetical protein
MPSIPWEPTPAIPIAHIRPGQHVENEEHELGATSGTSVANMPEVPQGIPMAPVVAKSGGRPLAPPRMTMTPAKIKSGGGPPTPPPGPELNDDDEILNVIPSSSSDEDEGSEAGSGSDEDMPPEAATESTARPEARPEGVPGVAEMEVDPAPVASIPVGFVLAMGGEPPVAHGTMPA